MKKFQLFRLSTITSILLVGLYSFGCDDCKETEEVLPDEQSDEYYVKYNGRGYSGAVITINNERVEPQEFEPTGFSAIVSFEIIIGPVAKGFESRFETPDFFEATIHVSKNDSPFALKAIGDSRPIDISYTIDY